MGHPNGRVYPALSRAESVNNAAKDGTTIWIQKSTKPSGRQMTNGPCIFSTRQLVTTGQIWQPLSREELTTLSKTTGIRAWKRKLAILKLNSIQLKKEEVSNVKRSKLKIPVQSFRSSLKSVSIWEIRTIIVSTGSMEHH